MKRGLALLISVLVGLSAALADIGAVYSETIYIKDGEEIQAKITEVTENAIWYELTSGDMTEYIGIDKARVERILSDDGSISKYSPTYCAPCSKGK